MPELDNHYLGEPVILATRKGTIRVSRINSVWENSFGFPHTAEPDDLYTEAFFSINEAVEHVKPAFLAEVDRLEKALERAKQKVTVVESWRLSLEPELKRVTELARPTYEFHPNDVVYTLLTPNTHYDIKKPVPTPLFAVAQVTIYAVHVEVGQLALGENIYYQFRGQMLRGARASDVFRSVTEAKKALVQLFEKLTGGKLPVAKVKVFKEFP